jgi:beta-phosphoglucomutase family hydrolase
VSAAGAHAAVFDMDGVLVDNSRFHREAWRRLCREEGLPPLDPEFWRRAIGRPVEEAVPAVLGRPFTPAEVTRLARRKTALYHELADGEVAAVPGVAPFIRALAARGVPRALATSAVPESAARIVGALALDAELTVRVTAGDVRRGKPDPEVYLAAARRLGVVPSACLVFEDAVVGVEAARRAGMRVVGVTTAYPAAELLSAGALRALPDFTGVTWEGLAAG